jgi:hypothetical protein
MRKIPLLFACAMTFVVMGSLALQAQTVCSPTNTACQHLQVTLNKAVQSLNVDVTSGAGDWFFVVTVAGKVSQLGRQIKNNPGAGDICWHSSILKLPSTFSDTAPSIPTAAPYACSPVGAPNYTDTNGAPLNLYTYIQTGDSKASVVIDVYYPVP